MSFVNFIDFNRDKDAALSRRTSPLIQFRRHTGVQLIPNNELPYIQTTNVNEGIELEDWTVYVVNLCTEEEIEITDYFLVDRIFQDTNGQAQFDWSITNVPFDFGSGLVYLKAVQSIGETFYSNAFLLTNNESEKTCRLDYKAKESDTMQSVQVQMFYWQDLKKTEISSYYEVSTGNTVTTLVKSQKYQRWTTDFIPNYVMIKIDDVFENKFVYVDLTRTKLFEANEIQEFTAEENFKTNIVKLSVISNDIYDPLYTKEVTSLVPLILLSSVTANGVNAIFDFSYSNFTPNYLTFQVSQDQTVWSSTNKGVTNTQSISFSNTGTWYFRVVHPEAISNTIALDLNSAVIANDDYANVQKGNTIDVSVLFNDSLVGETTITSLSTPTNGTAIIIENGTKIRYTHDDSVTTFDTFSYTISNGINNDTAIVNITVTNISGDAISFLMASEGDKIKDNSCLIVLDTLGYFTSENPTVNIGDIIYEDASLTNLYNGGNLYHAIENGKTIKINAHGLVTDVAIC